MRKLFSVLLILCCMCGLTACGIGGSSGEGKDPEQVPAVPEEIAGFYYDEIAGRATLEAETFDDGSVLINVRWPDSAARVVNYVMTAMYDAEKNTLVYEDAKATEVNYDADGSSTSKELYNHGTGLFEVKENKLVWQPKDDEATRGGTFVKGEIVNTANPFNETLDLDEAMEGSGVHISLPPTSAIPENVEPWKYRYSEDLLEVLYETVDNEMIIRKSNTIGSEELAGVYAKFASEWEQSVKGLTVLCKGDGEMANVVLFEYGDSHFCILYNPTPGAPGLTADQINSLVNGLQ